MLLVVFALLLFTAALPACHLARTQPEPRTVSQGESAPSEKPEPARPMSIRTITQQRFPILMERSRPWVFRAGRHLVLAGWYDWAVRVSEISDLGGEISIFDYGSVPKGRTFVDAAYCGGSYYALLAISDESRRPTGRTSLWRWNAQKGEFTPEVEQMSFRGSRIAANRDSLFVLESSGGSVYRYSPPGKLNRLFSLDRLLSREGMGSLPGKLNPRLLTFQTTADGFLFAGVSTGGAKRGGLARWILRTDFSGEPVAMLKLASVKEEVSGEVTDARFVPFAAGDRRLLAVYDGAFHWLDAALQPLAERPFESSLTGDESYGPVPADEATAFAWESSVPELTILEFDLSLILPQEDSSQ